MFSELSEYIDWIFHSSKYLCRGCWGTFFCIFCSKVGTFEHCGIHWFLFFSFLKILVKFCKNISLDYKICYLVKLWNISWSCQNLGLPHIWLISEVNDFDVTPTKEKLSTSSTRLWSALVTRMFIRSLKHEKTMSEIADTSNFQQPFVISSSL